MEGTIEPSIPDAAGNPKSGMLKKASSFVLAILPCSRTVGTLRAPTCLRPCWKDFFDHSRQLLKSIAPMALMSQGNEIGNKRKFITLIEGIRKR